MMAPGPRVPSFLCIFVARKIRAKIDVLIRIPTDDRPRTIPSVCASAGEDRFSGERLMVSLASSFFPCHDRCREVMETYATYARYTRVTSRKLHARIRFAWLRF